jgi:hypothetical protein
MKKGGDGGQEELLRMLFIEGFRADEKLRLNPGCQTD